MSEMMIEHYSFEECLRKDAKLARLRAHYAEADPQERRAAADWKYHEAIATKAFSRTLASIGQEAFADSPWPEGVLALAIDPSYAPALLTVGSIEYQLGREEEGFELLMRLTTLPADEPDLHVIIDKAGCYSQNLMAHQWRRLKYSLNETGENGMSLYLYVRGYLCG